MVCHLKLQFPESPPPLGSQPPEASFTFLNNPSLIFMMWGGQVAECTPLIQFCRASVCLVNHPGTGTTQHNYLFGIRSGGIWMESAQGIPFRGASPHLLLVGSPWLSLCSPGRDGDKAPCFLAGTAVWWGFFLPKQVPTGWWLPLHVKRLRVQS